MGFALCLELLCHKCGSVFGNTYSSPELPINKKPSPFVINDMMTLLFNRLGLVHTVLKEFCRVLGMPAMCLKTFQKKEWQIIHRTLEATGYVLNWSVAMVWAMHYEMQPDFPTDQPVPIMVSFDGTQDKRDHMSMHGVAAVIVVVTKLVMNYVILSTYCHRCGLMYTEMLGDGDSKAHKAVVDLESYGPDVIIEKEECLNHAYERRGTALLQRSKEKKLGRHGEGRFTTEKVLCLQQYYRYALNAGVGDVDNMHN